MYLYNAWYAFSLNVGTTLCAICKTTQYVREQNLSPDVMLHLTFALSMSVLVTDDVEMGKIHGVDFDVPYIKDVWTVIQALHGI